MKIKSIRPTLKKLPLTKPYTIAYDTFTAVELVFLEIELANGITGWGAASPAVEVTGEDPRQTFAGLQSEAVNSLIGRDIQHFQALIGEIRQKFPQRAGVQAAIDIALHDAFCQYIGIPVVGFYGRQVERLPTSVTIGIQDIRDTLAEAEAYYDLGFRVLKLKTGQDVEQDIEKVGKLRERLGSYVKIRVDANQGYTGRDLLHFFNATQHLDIELIEQPLPVGQEDRLKTLPSGLRQMLAGDESVLHAGSALKYSCEPRPFGIFNIKLMKCGGICAARDIATIAAQASIPLFWGCNDESRVSIAAALHAAYSCANTRYLDLDGSFDLAEDLVRGGFSIQDGEMILHTAMPGLGLEQLSC